MLRSGLSRLKFGVEEFGLGAESNAFKGPLLFSKDAQNKDVDKSTAAAR